MNRHVFLRDVKNWPQLEPRQFSAVFRVFMVSWNGSWMELPGNSPLKGPLISAEKSTQKTPHRWSQSLHPGTTQSMMSGDSNNNRMEPCDSRRVVDTMDLMGFNEDIIEYRLYIYIYITTRCHMCMVFVGWCFHMELCFVSFVGLIMDFACKNCGNSSWL